MPEFFDDILWGHTYKLLLDFPGPQLSSNQSDGRISVDMRDPEIDYSSSKGNGYEHVESKVKSFCDKNSRRDEDDRRHLGKPFRSSTGTVIYPNAYDPYPQSTTSRDSIPASRSVKSVTPLRNNRHDPIVLRRAHDDYVVSPRRSEFDSLSSATQKLLNATISGSTTSSIDRIQPIMSTASDKPASPFEKSRTRDDEPYYIQPAVSTRKDYNRHYSADSRDIDRLMAASRDDRDRTERGGYRNSGMAGGRGAYASNAPLVKQSKYEDDREYSYDYKDRTGNVYFDTAQRRRRRESVSGRKERPLSIAGLDDYLPKLSSSTRDTGPPVTNRAFDKIDKSGRQDCQSDTSSSRNDLVTLQRKDDGSVSLKVMASDSMTNSTNQIHAVTSVNGSKTERSIMNRIRRHRGEKPPTDTLRSWDEPGSWECRIDNDAIREDRTLRADTLTHPAVIEASKTTVGTADAIDAAVHYRHRSLAPGTNSAHRPFTSNDVVPSPLFEAKGRKESTLDKGKQSQTTEQLNERQSSPGSKTMSQGEETEATKVQNSMKARKRTKTGCLSMSSQSRATLELSQLTLSSVSEKAYQMWRGTANLC